MNYIIGLFSQVVFSLFISFFQFFINSQKKLTKVSLNYLSYVSSFYVCLYVSVCVSLRVSVYVCLCVCYQHKSKTNYSRNIKFSILHLYHSQKLLETVYEDRAKILCTGAHKRILIYYGLWTKFILSEFSYIQNSINVMKFTYIFAMVKNM